MCWCRTALPARVAGCARGARFTGLWVPHRRVHRRRRGSNQAGRGRTSTVVAARPDAKGTSGTGRQRLGCRDAECVARQNSNDSAARCSRNETVLPLPIPWWSQSGRLDHADPCHRAPRRTPKSLSQSGFYPVQNLPHGTTTVDPLALARCRSESTATLESKIETELVEVLSCSGKGCSASCGLQMCCKLCRFNVEKMKFRRTRREKVEMALARSATLESEQKREKGGEFLCSLCIARFSIVPSTVWFVYGALWIDKRNNGLQGQWLWDMILIFEKENGNVFLGITIGDVS
jgi:hypothetical protein